MRQFRPLRLSLFLIAAGEILSLVWLGKAIGVLGTIGVLVLAGIFGIALIRRSGLGLMKLVASGTSATGNMPGVAVGTLFAGMAGLLLIMPGLVSDAIALLLLLPFTRTQVAKLFRFEAFVSRPPPSASPPGDIIDAEAVEIIEPDRRLQ
jgi:UPF0716 protein FxsA